MIQRFVRGSAMPLQHFTLGAETLGPKPPPTVEEYLPSAQPLPGPGPQHAPCQTEAWDNTRAHDPDPEALAPLRLLPVHRWGSIDSLGKVGDSPAENAPIPLTFFMSA